jgi:hypothetical protein
MLAISAAGLLTLAGCSSARPGGEGNPRDSAVVLARDLAKVLPINQVHDMSTDTGLFIGADGSSEPQAPVTRATLTNGSGSFAAFDPVSQGIWIDQESSMEAASTEWSWISSSAHNLSVRPAYCDDMVFYGDWLDGSSAPMELADGLKQVGVTCSQEAGLGESSTTAAVEPTAATASASVDASSAGMSPSDSPSASPMTPAELFPVTDSNLELYGNGTGSDSAPAWSVPQFATPAQARALAEVHTSGPLTVLFLGMAAVSTTVTEPPTRDDEVGLQFQWSSAVAPGGNFCYVFSFDLRAEGQVVFRSGYESGQTSMKTVSQLESLSRLPGGSQVAGADLPSRAATWITRWDSIDITYYPNMTC